ncbi:GLPGLI family protein [Chryseobacterium takakiae]|uniref:GLPGLI family protein n=1 Tax=Chryseobacterium takakiae TaxID=1302685 RepID=A0A1M5A854_9FLAO|nr:GLPGLI family protein [Chryseobacterium takakiae]SHF26511.1 GLPGLI family protein [Chryseobacterium takakiae]
MKQIIFFSFLLLLMNFVKAQNLKVEYDRIIKEDLNGSLPAESSDVFKNKVIEELKKPTKEILYVLDGNTFYKSIPRTSITHEEESKKVDEHTTIRPKTEYKDIQTKIYHIKGDKGFYQYFSFHGDEYYYNYIPKFSKIEYKDDTEYIEKYKCKLAELTSDSGVLTKVWYTEDIPVSAGPYAYGNLPGLVLKIESPEYIVYATKVSNEAKKEDFENLNPKIKVLNEEEFFKKMGEFIEESKKVKKTENNIHL